MRFTILLILFFSLTAFAYERTERTIETEGQSNLVYQWKTSGWKKQSPVILLSGPNDNWNSDAAWFATLGPLLAQESDVYAVERAGIGLEKLAPDLGYQAFAKQLNAVIEVLEIDDFHIVAFASSNITLLHYINLYSDEHVKGAILIDPDVLTPFSIGRYSGDAKPFKENLSEYVAYLAEGKYSQRVKEKNHAEFTHINQLIEDKSNFDQGFLEVVLGRRLAIQNQINLFKEIAIYDQDLRSAATLTYPESLKLTIIDTDFEQGYIDKQESEEEVKALKKWRTDAKTHYFGLVLGDNKQLILKQSKEHLYQMVSPQEIKELLFSED